MNRRNRSGWTTALIVGGALLLAVLVWWRILSRNSSDAGYESSPDEYALEESYATDPGDEGYGAEANDYGDAAVTSDVTDASASEMSPREAEAGAVATLLPLDTPMSYTGTINPGGVATLNLTYFSTGRIMGTLDYSSGRHLEVIGHYTFRNSDRMVDLSLTTANADDPSYSESWTGHSSVVKDDMAHTLTFKEIYTSKGGAMTASFALRP